MADLSFTDFFDEIPSKSTPIQKPSSTPQSFILGASPSIPMTGASAAKSFEDDSVFFQSNSIFEELDALGAPDSPSTAKPSISSTSSGEQTHQMISPKPEDLVPNSQTMPLMTMDQQNVFFYMYMANMQFIQSQLQQQQKDAAEKTEKRPSKRARKTSPVILLPTNDVAPPALTLPMNIGGIAAANSSAIVVKEEEDVHEDVEEAEQDKESKRKRPSKTNIRRVSVSCTNCRKVHACCGPDMQRPCRRCVKVGLSDSCVDKQQQKRGPKGKKNKESEEH